MLCIHLHSFAFDVEMSLHLLISMCAVGARHRLKLRHSLHSIPLYVLVRARS